MKDVLAIVGSHPHTRDKFDFSRTDADVWMFNEALGNRESTWAQRADAVFQLHVPTIWQNPQNRNDPHHYEWLRSTLTTVYMQEKFSDVPASVAYPLDEIKALAGEPNFLTSSVSMAIALGVYQGYRRIEIYGVAMETDTEYRYQRDGVSYWMGFARGRGVEVWFADNTFDAPIYGYEGEVSLKYEQIAARVEALKAEQDTRRAAYHAAAQSAQQGFKQFIETGAEVDAKRFIPLLQQQINLGCALAEIDGAIQENQRYLGKADTMRQQSGDFVFSRQEFEQGAANSQKASQTLAAQASQAGGRVDYLFSILSKTSKAKHRRAKMDEFVLALNDYTQKSLMAALYAGVMQENFQWMSELDKYIRAAGGEKSEAVLLERLQNGMVAAQ